METVTMAKITKTMTMIMMMKMMIMTKLCWQYSEQVAAKHAGGHSWAAGL